MKLLPGRILMLFLINRVWTPIDFVVWWAQLHDHEDPDRLELCSDCVDKLSEFDRFRDVCLRVHYGLQVKTEPEHDLLKDEYQGKEQASSSDDEVAGGEEPLELPRSPSLVCCTIVFGRRVRSTFIIGPVIVVVVFAIVVLCSLNWFGNGRCSFLQVICYRREIILREQTVR
ncbi:AAEL017062-PA [Aedes aegypti]|uniref:AAEL017062-PA n=1 Tax=Aedes aegypti TaxID=7159 RepID=J9HGT8_AEDAE|nr:AAEL017062-PA [Aedes aegypti]